MLLSEAFNDFRNDALHDVGLIVDADSLDISERLRDVRVAAHDRQQTA